MKKLFTTLMVLGLVASSCGDSSGDASESAKDDAVANSGDVCDCLMNAEDDKAAQACAPGKSMQELMAMAEDCADKMIDEAMEDGMNSIDDAMEEGMDAYEDAMEDGMDAYKDAMEEGMDAYKGAMDEGMDAMMDAMGGGK